MENKRSKKFNSFEGIVFSTNPDHKYNDNEETVSESLEPQKQYLKVQLDRKRRGGKSVTLITGFIGEIYEVENLGKILKQKCGVGGSVKDNEILIQGDFVEKAIIFLTSLKYNVKRIGG